MRIFSLLIALAVAVGMTGYAAAQNIHLATYVEVAPASVQAGLALLAAYRTAARKEDGNLRVEIAQESGRANRFVLLEIWKDQTAFDAHGKAAAAMELRAKLKGIQAAPPDERVHRPFAVGPTETTTAEGAVYVATHVDVPPPRKDECEALLKALAEASRTGSGNLRFEVAQQTTRPNHFTVVEVWKDAKAYDSRTTADPQRQFRDKLGPMLGALYDERLYKAVN